MKHRFPALMLFLMAATFAAEANPVDVNTAREIAVKFVNANVKTLLQGAEDLQLVTTYRTESNDAAFHVFNTPNGFVIVSADDCATPVLGYSDEGQFDMEDIPVQLEEYLQGFVEQIEYGITHHLAVDETIAHRWKRVQTMGQLNEQRVATAVAPMLTDTWHQNCYYNTLCPAEPNGPCGHTWAGCAATSFAQIMRYWGYPTTGTGSHSYTLSGYPQQSADFGATTYDWANMPNSLSSSSTSTEINAVATLIWHCGVAVDTRYGPNGSGAEPADIATALVNYFGYSDELSIVFKDDYCDAEWLALIKNCLDLGRPVHYCGFNQYGGGGHGFVCDGYDISDLLHFNWGWSGSCNGYYSISAMNPGSYVFAYDNMAIINIHPDSASGPFYQITASVNPLNCGTISGAGAYSYGTVCTLTATANEGYSFINWTKDGEEISTETIYSFTVTEDATIVANFLSNNGQITQTVTLPQGWTWWSSYIDLSDVDGLTLLEESLGENGLVIKSRDAYVEYSSQTGWTGSLQSIDNESGYKIKVAETCTAVIIGPMAVSSDHPITLNQGWNWIGYPVSEAQSVTSALSGFTPAEGDIIKGQDSYATYSTGAGWTPSDFTLNPGESYMYYSNASGEKTLIINQVGAK